MSPTVVIGGEEFKSLGGIRISPVEGDGLEVLPPVPVDDGSVPSESMETRVNPYGCLSFPKITGPDWGGEGCVARFTGLPANEPDWIADHHWIAMARLVDKAMMHQHRGTIGGGYDTPRPPV